MECQLMIKDLPKEERPRERLIRFGPKTLTNTELLAIMLRTGSFGENVLQISQKLLHKYPLHALSKQPIPILKNEFGIGEAKACNIIAAFELGKRAKQIPNGKKQTIHCSKDLAKLFMDEMGNLQKEQVKGIYLNARKQIIKEETLFIGTLDASLIHPRDIFSIAFAEGAAAIILVHNHPSGDPTPSNEDIEITKDIVKAGEILGIQVLDHIIIGNGRYCSLKEEGYLSNP